MQILCPALLQFLTVPADMSSSQSWLAGMKIYDRNLTGTSASETGQAQETQSLSRAGKTNSQSRISSDGSNDRVEFSGTLSQLSRALTAFESSRSHRVQTLAANYRSGNYKPDSAATSRGLVAEALSAGLPAGLQ